MSNHNDQNLPGCSMISFAEIDAAQGLPESFDVPWINGQIEKSGLNSRDFYFLADKSDKPFVYYRGVVYLELGSVDQILSMDRKKVKKLENRLYDRLREKDYYGFFASMHENLLVEMFVESFNFIPDEQKYPLYQRIVPRIPQDARHFSDAFTRKVLAYKGANGKLPTSENGTVEIYTIYPENDGEKPSSYTIDVNLAIASMLDKGSPELYHTDIALENIQDYSPKKGKMEVVVSPSTNLIWKPMKLISLAEARCLMENTGLAQILIKYQDMIQQAWFQNPKGIHAVAHTRRVLYLVTTLAALQKLVMKDVHTLCRAAVFHDIGRTTDGFDLNHGLQSYQKLIRHGLLSSADVEWEVLRYIIENHAIPDNRAQEKIASYKLTDPEQSLRLFQVFKDADGLDRVRIQDLNPSYLRTPEAKKLILLAHQLYRLDNR